MNNRMKDLDFEQTVVFDTVKDFEFTRQPRGFVRWLNWIVLKKRIRR